MHLDYLLATWGWTMHCIIHMNGATTMTTTIALWTTVLKFGIMAVAILLFLEPEGTIQYLYEMVKLGGIHIPTPLS